VNKVPLEESVTEKERESDDDDDEIIRTSSFFPCFSSSLFPLQYPIIITNRQFALLWKHYFVFYRF
jgi:hypothetical protein